MAFLTQVKALIVRFRNAFSTSSGIFSIWAIQPSMHVNVSLGAWGEMKTQLIHFSLALSHVKHSGFTLSSVSRPVWVSLLSGFRVLASWMERTGSLSCSSHAHMSPLRTKGSRSIHSLSQPPPWFSSACTQSGSHVRLYLPVCDWGKFIQRYYIIPSLKLF